MTNEIDEIKDCINIFKDMGCPERLHNPSPGEILNEEFLKPLGIKQSTLATALGCNRSHVNHIIKQNKKISKSLDKRLCLFLGLSQGFFLGLQNDYLKEVNND